mmetsp:Transcript_6528/g.14117  ORF Transcript_6528/g.14117 Transcript_6528/m.14117 type:complete len:141 (-) Transcript_6528:116-538(-)
MGQCRDTKGDRSTVDNEIVDFSDITEHVLNGNFDYKFLPTLTLKAPSLSDESKDNGLLLPTKQAKKDGDKKKPETIVNTGQCEEFKMRKDKDWSMNKNKMTLKWRAEWDESCKMCPRGTREVTVSPTATMRPATSFAPKS